MGCHLPGTVAQASTVTPVLSQGSRAPNQLSSLGWNRRVRLGAPPPRILRRGRAWEELREVRDCPRSCICLSGGFFSSKVFFSDSPFQHPYRISRVNSFPTFQNQLRLVAMAYTFNPSTQQRQVELRPIKATYSKTVSRLAALQKKT